MTPGAHTWLEDGQPLLARGPGGPRGLSGQVGEDLLRETKPLREEHFVPRRRGLSLLSKDGESISCPGEFLSETWVVGSVASVVNNH
jgi:hypothetical protein